MRFITGFVFICNILLWLFFVIGFFTEFFLLGIGALFGFIGFIIAYSVSDGFAVSISDYFFQPYWDVFMRKIKWANIVGVITGIAVITIIITIVNEFF